MMTNEDEDDQHRRYIRTPVGILWLYQLANLFMNSDIFSFQCWFSHIVKMKFVVREMLFMWR